jgi:hypothetical protein
MSKTTNETEVWYQVQEKCSCSKDCTLWGFLRQEPIEEEIMKWFQESVPPDRKHLYRIRRITAEVVK